jgi:hypothetical protein
VTQRLAHEVQDNLLHLGDGPRLRRADPTLVHVGEQRNIRLAISGNPGHRPPAEHPLGDIPGLKQLDMFVPFVPKIFAYSSRTTDSGPSRVWTNSSSVISMAPVTPTFLFVERATLKISPI